jgi:superfamily II DNA/RNA helicase
LGHAATLIEADIPEYMWAIASRDRIPKELCRGTLVAQELTSRLSADEIPGILERLSVRYPKSTEEDERPLDALLATNMISVGVDVDRLGLMVVLGQPKTTSEYIQASSRVGRSAKAPGLVVTMYNPGKPRDRSHYEHFRGYHAAFYKHVEPTSVTPYALPVLERALHAVLVIAARQRGQLKEPDRLDTKAAWFTQLLQRLRERCERTDPEHRLILESRLAALLAHWAEYKPREWGSFGVPAEAQTLMYPAGSEPNPLWDDNSWQTPTSMRNVDVECEAQIIGTYPDPNE